MALVVGRGRDTVALFMNPSKDPGKVSRKFKMIQLEIPASDFKIGKL